MIGILVMYSIGVKGVKEKLCGGKDMKILFVRHGKDDSGYRGGWSAMDLTDEGKIQAAKLAEFLYAQKCNLNISGIVSSDLPRTVSTAKAISDKLEIPFRVDTQLREMNNGELAGMKNEVAVIKYPGLYFNTLEMDEKYPNGESPKEFFDRIRGWFFNFIRIYGQFENNIVVVTHSGVINIVYYIVNEMNWTNKAKPFKVSNCSLHILNTETMKFEEENNTCFLG